MKKYTLVKFLSLDKAVLKRSDGTYLASFADVPLSGPEVLVFPCDTEGYVDDYTVVDGRKGYRNLQEFLSEHLTIFSNN